MHPPSPKRFRNSPPILAALWLTLLSALVLLAPVWIPGDGLVWRPGSDGLVIHRIAQVREVAFAPGQRIVYFNGTPWASTRQLHQTPPFFPLQTARIGYEIRDGEWKLRRQVLQSPLPVSASLKAYWCPAVFLLLLAIVALTPWRHDVDVLPLAAMGSALAVWSVVNQSLALFLLFQLRHLEMSALLLAYGLGALLKQFVGPKNRFAGALPWLFITGVTLSWIVTTDRWDWWRSVQWGLATCGAATLAAGIAFFVRRARVQSGSANRLPGS